MIFEKLQQARVLLQEKKIKKSGKNKFSGFTYYELADILPQINQIFYDLKMHSNFSIANETASLTVTDWEDNTSETFTSPIETLELKGCTKIQALGGVHTYLKRYLYLNALEIVENDMLDAEAGHLEEEQPDNDLDLFEGLKACSDLKMLAKYYQDNFQYVKNKKEFVKIKDSLKAKFSKGA